MDPVALTDVARIVSETTPRAGATRVVAIDGPSGSGKSTLGRRLAEVMGSPLVQLDDIYPGWDGLAEAPGLLVDQIFTPLSAGEAASYRRWDWEAHAWAESHDVPDAEILLVEGVGSGALVCAPFLSHLIWVEAPRDLRMQRGLERDGEAYRPHWERWAAQEQVMFASDRTRERADLLVDGAPSITHDPEREIVLLR